MVAEAKRANRARPNVLLVFDDRQHVLHDANLPPMFFVIQRIHTVAVSARAIELGQVFVSQAFVDGGEWHGVSGDISVSRGPFKSQKNAQARVSSGGSEQVERQHAPEIMADAVQL